MGREVRAPRVEGREVSRPGEGREDQVGEVGGILLYLFELAPDQPVVILELRLDALAPNGWIGMCMRASWGTPASLPLGGPGGAERGPGLVIVTGRATPA